MNIHFMYAYAVMGNELDKIEQNGNQIAKHPKISEGTGQQLKEEVKVCLSCGIICLAYLGNYVYIAHM